MVTQKQLKEHALNIKDTIYVWGANFEIITKELMSKLHSWYGTSTYNKAYYDGKLKEGAGKFGADCSGALKPISGYDTTAQGYYERCVKKGRIATIPRDKVLLVFKENSEGRKTHVGIYTGDGQVSELASSKLNYQRKPLDNNGWDDWGYADFVTDYDKEEVKNLDVDGEWGRDTTSMTQKVLGTTVDGIVSRQPVSCAKYCLNALESSWKFLSEDYKKGSEMVRAIQELVGLTGRDVDGHFGYQTIVYLQKFLKNLGLYSGKIDGFMGERTVKAWQMYINSRL